MTEVVTRFAWCAALCLITATPAVADMSACQSAVGTNVKERIADLTTCIVKGRNGASENSFLYMLRGASHSEVGEEDAALKDYSTAIELHPEENLAHIFRGEIFADRGEWSSAQADFDSAAVHATPSTLSASLVRKAWLFATWSDSTMRDGPRAITLARKAIKARDNPYGHDVLAAAYAEAGQFDNAAREEGVAISRLSGRSKDEALPGYRERLALYQANMPYHTRRPFPHGPRVEL
jgi:tetratricopeptide (TPR) repeat protein